MNKISVFFLCPVNYHQQHIPEAPVPFSNSVPPGLLGPSEWQILKHWR
jgi:hypothetical protein